MRLRPVYLISAACLTITLMVTLAYKTLLVNSDASVSPLNKSLGEHYSRIAAVPLMTQNTSELERLLNSMVADESIVQAAIYLPDGHRIALQGDTRTLPNLLRNSPELQSSMVAIRNQTATIGYLQWLSLPNTD